MALALDDGLLPPDTSVFDYGCGRGDDLRRLAALGFEVAGWDPGFRPHAARREADVVNLGYVINVIEDPDDRALTLRAAWELTRGVLVVSARPDWEAKNVPGRPHGDGILTGRGTFQKFYDQEELRSWIEGLVGTRPIAAAPGIFYVFRDEVRAQGFLAARTRHRPTTVRRVRVTEALYEANRDVLDPLVAFLESRGRAPEPFELPAAAALRDRFGSAKAALALVKRATRIETWQIARAAATDDLTVYLALAAFGGRPKFTCLPADIQLDVRTFFGSYKEACSAADDLLFGVGAQEAIERACRESTIGKLTPEALYVHASAVTRLCPLLRVYEGCARALTGTVDGATVVKLGRLEPKVAYLVYPGFDRHPHPALATSVRADLRHLHVEFTDFRASANPPILHRKETFVPEDYPGREKFARLTGREERLGLLQEPTGIGTRDRWTALVTSRGFRFSGHRLVRGSAILAVAQPAISPRTHRDPAPRAAVSATRPEPAVVEVPPRPRLAVQRCKHGLAAGACTLCGPPSRATGFRPASPSRL